MSDIVGVGFLDDQIVLVVHGTSVVLTPAEARFCANLMTQAADWIDPVVAEPLDMPD